MRTSSLHPLGQLRLQFGELRAVCLPARPDQDITREPGSIESRQNDPAKELTQSSLDAVAFDDRVLVPRNDHTDPRIRYGGRGIEHVHMGRPTPLPPPKQCADLTTARNPPRTRKALTAPLLDRRR